MCARPLVQRNLALAPLTTYKLGGPAAWFAEVADAGELEVARSSVPEGTQTMVLGRGSNIVFSDAGFDGLVIKLGGEFLEVDVADATVSAGGGVALPRLARLAAAAGRGGLEFYVGIPGSVGGAVCMNAGGHGADTAAVLLDARILRHGANRAHIEQPAGLDLRYRSSNLGDGDIVISARFATTPVAPDVAEGRLRAITRWRKEHQPGGTLNAGSVFKNPPGDAAGRIIDDLGLKGYRRGAVSISTLHANFFAADPGATAEDVWQLVHDVRRRVGEATGVWLEPEIRFVGEFRGASS